MKVALVPVGTRGDVEPMIMLAKALRARGHEVIVGAPEDHRARIQSAQLPFRRVGVGLEERLRDLGLERVSKLRAMSMARELVIESAPTQLEETLQACEGADIVIGAGTGFGGFHAAELLGIPYGFVVYAPGWLPSATHPPVLMPFHALPRFVNRWLWRFLQRQGDATLLAPVNAWRRQKGLPPLDGLVVTAASQVLLACDAVLGTAPADMQDVIPGWPITAVSQPGALVAEGPLELSRELEAFLDAGPPPIFVGFGSMVDATPEKTGKLLSALANKLELRVVWGLGWTERPKLELSERVLPVTDEPFCALFPRCRLALHHGGAGTTATALRSAVPQLIVPHIADQFFFARRVFSLGLGLKPIPRTKLGGRRLEQALREFMTSEGDLRRVAEKTQRTLPRDPVTVAADWVERTARTPRGPTAA
ncbi:MAG: glycosyltransferase family 1 protein [Deltaproteobacteria bacterium]|nr:glycosyltransferase family 1 protein [Deltaproteobacteria bacterium]